METLLLNYPDLKNLISILKDMESVIVAYSGGVDSTFLLKTAALSDIRTMAVTAVSPTMPEHDLGDAEDMARTIGVRHMIIRSEELESSDFTKNPPDRCFYCKDELFGKLGDIAMSGGYRYVADGSNPDDMDDWRPGRKAAEMHNVRSPLIEAGIDKQRIRELSKVLGLRTWDKPSSPCLSSRFPYGVTITIEALRQVEDAEKFLKSIGFNELRVRHHRDTARIELREDDIQKMADPGIRKSVTEKLRGLGYKYVCLDLEGFRSGKLNG